MCLLTPTDFFAVGQNYTDFTQIGDDEVIACLDRATRLRETSPTLLVVGGSDPVVLDLNRQALARLRCESRLAVVPEATHLFAEPGALQQVTELSRDWFSAQMSPAPAPAGS